MGYSQSNAPHNYRWYYGGDEVTVQCTKCGVDKTFDLRGEWEKCVAWCNEHSKTPGVPREEVPLAVR